MAPLNSLVLHPQAELVPRMSPAQAAEFESDITARGIRVPLEIIDGNVIIDGRSRYLAAQKLGFDQVPVIDAPTAGEPPVLYMLRSASKRRHLTEDQLACLALEEMKILTSVSRKERAAKAGQGNRHTANHSNSAAISSAKCRDRSSDARTIAASRYGVSQRRIRTAKRLQEISPALFEQAKSGEKRLAVAKREAQRQVRRKELREQARQASQITNKDQWEIRLGDCLDELRKIEPGSVRLVFADPPYNIGIDYGDGAAADLLPRGQYLAWWPRVDSSLRPRSRR